MDSQANNAKEAKNTENDEVDGSVISRFRRRRGVKVTGKYIPPLEWEEVNASHSASSLNNSYFEKVYDAMENVFQASDASTKLLFKDERQGSAQTGHGRDNTHKTEKQRMEPMASKQTSDTKDAENVPKEKINDKQRNEKSDEDVLPCGLAIPKETLEELKHFLKESSLINCKSKGDPKINTSVTHIHIPKHAENRREKPGLTFETFRPWHLEKETQKQNSEDFLETEQSSEIPIDSGLSDPAVPQKEDHQLQTKPKTFNGKQILIQDQLNIPTENKFELPAEFKDVLPTSSKNADRSDGDGIQDSFSIIALSDCIKQQIVREDIRFVRFEAADLHGVSRSKTIPARFFQEKAVNGICIPRSYLELILEPKDKEVDHLSSKQYNCDIFLKPDLHTFQVLPWTEKTARVICDSFTLLGNPLHTSPRYLAKRLLSQLQEAGFLLSSAFIYEFCIFAIAEIINSKTISIPAATLLSDHQPFMQEMLDVMYYIGVDIESFSSSSVPGQVEVSFLPEYGLTAADNAFTFKTGIKEVARKQDYIASFYTDSMGFYNSGVLSHSLWDVNGCKNVFHSGSHEEVLTDIGKKWLSGLLEHSAALSCLFAPGVAPRKRFLKNDKDPQDSICASWGSNNTTCTYNIKSHGNNGIYIDNMLCSATANPYLVLAATIAAGLDGIRRNLDLLEGANSQAELKAPSIPVKLEDALSALEEDTCMRASLGEPFIHYFITMKRYELEIEEGSTEKNKFLEYFI